MTEDKKDKKPKFNIYWVYGAITLLFIGIQFFESESWAQPSTTTQAQFEQYLRDGDVEKVKIVNRKIAKVYLTPEAKDKEKHKKTKGSNFLPDGKQASYQFEFGDLQNFENSLDKIKSQDNSQTTVVYETDNNVWGEVIIVLLPFIGIIGIIGIIIFIMIRMSSGGAGGDGGQIFNFGKSKAKFFNEKSEVKTEKKLQKLIVRNFKGTQIEATRNFKRDSVKMAEKGYYPTSQNWSPGSYGYGSFILALLLCIILIGILVFIYMLIVKPNGTLSVTYELKKENNEIVEKKNGNLEEKECPECAEMVKEKAKICRFCRHEFIN